MKACEKFQVKCVPISVKESSKQQEANKRSPQKLKGKKTDKNLKIDDVSKSRGLKSRKTRVQKPKNK